MANKSRSLKKVMKPEYGWAVLKENTQLDRMNYGFMLPWGSQSGKSVFKYLIYSDEFEAREWCNEGDRLVKIKMTEVRR